MCLSACKYDHAKDTHAKLEVMAKCEPGELSRCLPARCTACTLRARALARLGTVGTGVCASADLTVCMPVCAHPRPGITLPTSRIVPPTRTTATSNLWVAAANTAPTCSRGDGKEAWRRG